MYSLLSISVKTPNFSFIHIIDMVCSLTVTIVVMIELNVHEVLRTAFGGYAGSKSAIAVSMELVSHSTF